MAFRSIDVSGFGYSLAGNLIALDAGITNSGPSGVTISLPCRLNGNQAFQSGTNVATIVFHGPIDVNGFDLTFTGSGGTEVFSPIQGAGGVIKQGGGILILHGTNTYTGVTRILAGSVYLDNRRALGGSAAGTEVVAGASLLLQRAGTYDEPLIFYGGDFLTTPAQFTLTGPVVLAGSTVNFQILSIQGLAINGVISGTGGVNLDGELILNGTNTYTGTNVVHSGTLTVNGQQAASDVLIHAGALLQGTGRVGRITSFGGRLQPGLNSIGTLSCSNLIFDALSTFAVSGRSRLSVSGTVNLGNAFLSLSSFDTDGNKFFVLIANDGSEPIIDKFGDLPESEPLLVNGNRLFITYNSAGFGNDVQLLIAAAPPSATGITRVWDGGGTSLFWSEPQNWVGDVAPRPGDDLEFPVDSAQRTNVNDFAAGTTFNRLRLPGYGFRLEGSQLALNAGLSATHTNGDNELALPIYLNKDQSFVNSLGLVRFTAPIKTAGSLLDFGGQGSVDITGPISGTGSIRKSGLGHLSLRAPNTYSGDTYVDGGELSVVDPSALGSVRSGTVVAGILTIFTNIAEPLTVYGSLRSVGETSGTTNIVGGPLTLEGAAQLQVSNVLVIPDFVGGFRKVGAGTLILNSTNQGNNGSWVSNGTLVVNATFTGPLSLLNGTIGGTGRLNSVNAPDSPASTNRAVSPGLDYPGALTIGQVNFSKSQLSGAPVRLVIQLNGTEPGSGYDQLKVEQSVSLDNAQLEISLGFTPAIGDRFLIVETPTQAVGQFSGRREGAVFMVGDTQFQITYRGGAGNDVELRVTTGLPLTRTWIGTGTNSFWSTPENWIDSIPPTAGDVIVFPNSLASQTTNINDFPLGTAFSTLIIDGRFQLTGAPATLQKSLLAYESAVIDMPISLAADLYIGCDKGVYASSPVLEFLAPVDLAGHDLLISNSAPIRFRGEIGAGNLIKAGSGTVDLYTNNLHQRTTVISGELGMFHTGALASTDFGTEVRPGGTLAVAVSNAIVEPLLLQGTLRSHSVPSNVWAGDITLEGENPIVDTSNRLLIGGTVQGTGALTKVGLGSLTLLASNTYTGNTILSNGSLFINGHQPQSSVLIRGAAFLSGSGVSGTITVSGGLCAISPGSGSFATSVDVARLSTMNLYASPAGVISFNLAGTNPGTHYDQFNVNGAVSLSNARFELRFGFQPPLNQSFLLIENDGTDPVAGTFFGLPEGAAVVQSNMLFQLTYIGGDGNDVALTRIPIPSSTLGSVKKQNTSVTLQGSGISNLIYSIESTTNLNPPIRWSPLGSAVASRSNVYQFVHTNALSLPMRFYRAVSP